MSKFTYKMKFEISKKYYKNFEILNLIKKKLIQKV